MPENQKNEPQQRRTRITTTIPTELYQAAKRKNLKFSWILAKTLREMIRRDIEDPQDISAIEDLKQKIGKMAVHLNQQVLRVYDLEKKNIELERMLHNKEQ